MIKALVDWAPAVFAIVLLIVGALTCFRRQSKTSSNLLDMMYCVTGFVLATTAVMIAIIAIPGLLNGIRPIP